MNLNICILWLLLKAESLVHMSLSRSASKMGISVIDPQPPEFSTHHPHNSHREPQCKPVGAGGGEEAGSRLKGLETRFGSWAFR
jgi:hypothetical protein